LGLVLGPPGFKGRPDHLEQFSSIDRLGDEAIETGGQGSEAIFVAGN
jgi:hypothetical protein